MTEPLIIIGLDGMDTTVLKNQLKNVQLVTALSLNILVSNSQKGKAIWVILKLIGVAGVRKM
jgi:hypothetical protein